MTPEIIYEDKFILVVKKPAGMATESADIRQEDLVSWTAKHRAACGEDPYVGLLSRLDQPVEGLVVLAKDAKSADRLTAQIQDKTFQKYYLAVVRTRGTQNDGSKDGEWIRLEDYLVKDGGKNTSRVAAKSDRRARKAMLRYRDVTAEHRPDADRPQNGRAATETLRILDVRLGTGRHHQIRVQLSHAGMPIAGDTKYGGKNAGDVQYGQLGLFAYHVCFRHPADGRPMEFDAEMPLDIYGFHKKTVIE